MDRWATREKIDHGLEGAKQISGSCHANSAALAKRVGFGMLDVNVNDVGLVSDANIGESEMESRVEGDRGRAGEFGDAEEPEEC